MHGDEFDVVVRHAKWLAFLGDWAYETALFLNTHFNAARRAVRLQLLVVLGLGQAQGQERGQFHRLRSKRELAGEAQASRRRRRRLRPHPSRRRSARSTASLTSTPATSSNPARWSSSMTTAGSRSLRWPESCGALARGGRRAEARGRADRGGGGSGVMRILVATDAWRPQVNGVVHTLERMAAAAREARRRVRLPDAAGLRRPSPLPTYPDIRARARLAVGRSRGASRRRGADHIHIATEGPIGWRRAPLLPQRGRLFTTSYHTRFPEYIAARTPHPRAAGPMPACAASTRPRRR